jgi:hypothetical protein
MTLVQATGTNCVRMLRYVPFLGGRPRQRVTTMEHPARRRPPDEWRVVDRVGEAWMMGWNPAASQLSSPPLWIMEMCCCCLQVMQNTKACFSCKTFLQNKHRNNFVCI